MYGLTNFLTVIWYTVLGWFGIGRERAHAVTLYSWDDDAPCSHVVAAAPATSASLDLHAPVVNELAEWSISDPSRSIGPFSTAADAMANGGAGIEISKNLYV